MHEHRANTLYPSAQSIVLLTSLRALPMSLGACNVRALPSDLVASEFSDVAMATKFAKCTKVALGAACISRGRSEARQLQASPHFRALPKCWQPSCFLLFGLPPPSVGSSGQADRTHIRTPSLSLCCVVPHSMPSCLSMHCRTAFGGSRHVVVAVCGVRLAQNAASRHHCHG